MSIQSAELQVDRQLGTALLEKEQGTFESRTATENYMSTTSEASAEGTASSPQQQKKQKGRFHWDWRFFNQAASTTRSTTTMTTDSDQGYEEAQPLVAPVQDAMPATQRSEQARTKVCEWINSGECECCCDEKKWNHKLTVFPVAVSQLSCYGCDRFGKQNFPSATGMLTFRILFDDNERRTLWIIIHTFWIC